MELVLTTVHFCKNAQGLVWLDLAMTLKLFNTKNLVTGISGTEPFLKFSFQLRLLKLIMMSIKSDLNNAKFQLLQEPTV